MRTWLTVSLLIAACGGSSKSSNSADGTLPVEVSKITYTHTTCDDCAIETPAEPQFRPPDEAAPTLEAGADADEVTPTCRLAAEAMASIELGNYADADARAPVVAKAEQRCRTAKLSRDDLECLADARTRDELAYCAPKLYSNVPSQVVTPKQCDEAGNRMRLVLERQLANVATSDALPYMRQLGAAIEACKRDRWNPAMLQCAQVYVPMHASYCQYVTPNAIWRRLAARLEAAKTK